MDGINPRNPAALSAASRGDLKNARVASTPGGIEAQEAAGQAELVAHGNKLPRHINYPCGLTRGEVRAATGIEYGDELDDLFVAATLPPGWRLVATEHSMWSELLDAAGCRRAEVFYKAAFYDRAAHITFRPRYQEREFNDLEHPTLGVVDNKTGEILFTTGEARTYDETEANHEAAAKWLADHFPDHRNPLAYW